MDFLFIYLFLISQQRQVQCLQLEADMQWRQNCLVYLLSFHILPPAVWALFRVCSLFLWRSHHK